MTESHFAIGDRDFLIQCLRANLRLDGRGLEDAREPVIQFGREWGSAMVSLGHTRILAHCRFDLVEPRESRPSEGILQVNLDYSPAAGKGTDTTQTGPWMEIQRALEKMKKECSFVELESLCVVSGKRVWEVIVDLVILCDDGNLLECASIALVAALKHFRHPDVTMSGDKPVVHSLRDRDPVPLTFTHHPVFSTYAFLEKGEYLVVDPLEDEESAQDGILMIAANTFGEICGFHQAGIIPAGSSALRKCCQLAVKRAKSVVEALKAVLDEDRERRAKREVVGFTVECFSPPEVLVMREFEPSEVAMEEGRRSDGEAVSDRSSPPSPDQQDAVDGDPEQSAAPAETSSDEDEPMPVIVKLEKPDDGNWGMEVGADEVEEVQRLTAADRIQNVEILDEDEEEGELKDDDEEPSGSKDTRERSERDKGKRLSKSKPKKQKWFADQW